MNVTYIYLSSCEWVHVHHKLNQNCKHHLVTSELKEFADDNFKFNENGGKLSERVENTVGKGEIACYEPFLLFQQLFQILKTFTADT